MALNASRPFEALRACMQQLALSTSAPRLQPLSIYPSSYSYTIPRLLPILFPTSISLAIPTLGSIWESILRAVPKKKTSHRKKRQRFLAGKALKDVTELNKCSACGNTKKAHLLCPYCVREIKDMWIGRGTKDIEEARREAMKESKTTMSKQYLTTYTIDDAHITDIFSLAVASGQIISASGSSSLKVHSTDEQEFPLKQTLEKVHRLGCHHLSASKDGLKLASTGFEGQCILWDYKDGEWKEGGKIVHGNKAGEIWAIALSQDGRYLASTTYDGRINVWDTSGERQQIQSFETKGSYGMTIDISPDGTLTASGHQNGSVYIFKNELGRLYHSLPGLVKPVRAVAFSPAGKLLAAAGDSKVIALYDVSSGEQIANLTGHGAWIFSIDWSFTGEYLLSGAFDGKIKVWSIDTRNCVATHTETDKTIWAVKWLPKATGKSEMFAAAGANRSISFYREATGG
ncbi:MAG: hypothetical protein LQ340_000032 [Diploschistes diacapsis]|nr:MAG: hypothetical protein LQ340_000032 [Diploschistes diacapsis]